MDTMITVNFPKPVYQRLRQQAKVMKMPITDVVVETVKRNLPLWLDLIPSYFEEELAQLDHLSISQLQKIAKSRLPLAKQRKLDRLLQKNSEGVLTSKQLAELDNVHLEADFLMLKKAKALALLKDKGYDLPISDIQEMKQ